MKDAMQVNTKSLIDLTKKLVEFKSITPQQNGCIDFIQDYLTKLNFKTVRLDRNDTSNLFAIWEANPIANNLRSSDMPVVAFAGHVDVVPTGDLSQWIHDPFTLTLQDDLLYGRGISDMKGGIASFMYAANAYIKYVTNPINNTQAAIKIAFILTSDEEGAAIDGTAIIVEYLKQHKIKLDYCIIGEPSCTNTLGDTVKIGRRGSFTAHVEITGKQGHVAYPELCINPIYLAIKALGELQDTVWDNGNDVFPPTALQITNIHSGIGIDNVIPNNLFARFNLRYNNSIAVEDIKKTILTIFNKYNLDYSISWLHGAKPFLAKRGRLIEVVNQVIKMQCGITPQQKTDGGTSDGRFLIEVCDELLELGLNNRYIHQINEHIEIKDLIKLTQIYYTILNILNEVKYKT